MVLDVAKGAANGARGAGRSRPPPGRLPPGSRVVSHIYPVWLGFQGGKGVATTCGVFAVLAPLPTAIAGAFFAGNGLVDSLHLDGPVVAVLLDRSRARLVRLPPLRRRSSRPSWSSIVTGRILDGSWAASSRRSDEVTVAVLRAGGAGERRWLRISAMSAARCGSWALTAIWSMRCGRRRSMPSTCPASGCPRP